MLIVKPIRERAGISQESLAEAADISVWTVRRIENQPDYEPGVLAAHRIARALGVTVDDLLHDQNGKDREPVRGQIKQGGGTNRKASATASHHEGD